MLTIVGVYFLTIEVLLLTLGVFLLAIEVHLLTMGIDVPEHLREL